MKGRHPWRYDIELDLSPISIQPDLLKNLANYRTALSDNNRRCLS